MARMYQAVFFIAAMRFFAAFSASIAGIGLPARKSMAAPPPVDTWEIRSEMPSCSTASVLWPPPTTENFACVAAFRMASVPMRKSAFSKMPAGPLITTLSAWLMMSPNFLIVSCPMSEIT